MAVETGIMAMLLVIVFAGMVDAAWMFGDTYKVTSAARGGARMASGNPMSPTIAQDAARQARQPGWIGRQQGRHDPGVSGRPGDRRADLRPVRLELLSSHPRTR